MIVHGSNHVTSDIDFAFRRTRENASKLAQALAALHPKPEGWDPDLPFVWDASTVHGATILTLITDIGSIDLLGETPGVESYDALARGAAEVTLYGHPLLVASLDDLIRMKTAADRPKDRRHLPELQSLKSLKEYEPPT